MAAPRSKTLIVGTGAIGGTIAGLLTEHGATEAVAHSPNAAIAEAVEADGFRLTGHEEERAIPGRVVRTLEELGAGFDWILLATPPDRVEDAAEAVAPLLAEGGAVVVLQNGLCEDRVAARLAERTDADPKAVLGAIVSFGASMPEPGLFDRTSEGGFNIGRMDAEDDPRLDALAELLEPIGPVEKATNFAGARWSKLAINCAISTLGTLAGARLGKVLRSQLARRLALEIMSEVVAVASAEGVALEKVSGTIDLDWIALTESERRHRGSIGLVAKHALLMAVGARYRKLRSSMLAALERGRTPPVDFLNGEVVRIGARHGVQAPVNAVATAMVHELVAGTLEPTMGNIEVLAERTDERMSSRPPRPRQRQ